MVDPPDIEKEVLYRVAIILVVGLVIKVVAGVSLFIKRSGASQSSAVMLLINAITAVTLFVASLSFPVTCVAGEVHEDPWATALRVTAYGATTITTINLVLFMIARNRERRG